MPYAMKESELPLQLPSSNNFKPSGTGEGPLANLSEWINFAPDQKRDSNTMPTHAGAAWYFLRYMDPHNQNAFADKKALDYWNQVDVYIGGSEHAVAHLLYSRLWTKVLHDLGYLNFDEPFKKLINQGKITGDSRFVYRVSYYQNLGMNVNLAEVKVSTPEIFLSKGIVDQIILGSISRELKEKIYKTYNPEYQYEINPPAPIPNPIHVDIRYVNGLELDIEGFKKWRIEYENAIFFLDDDKYICGSAIEKMSKSYYNVVNPDDIIDNYGADTLRMYEMFLGPLEASKPWSTQGIDGVFKFLRRVWNLFHNAQGNLNVSDAEPTKEELKALHKLIKKAESDIENYSFNTSVSEFMICANELSSLKCNKRSVLEPLLVVLSPYAPHITQELWEKLGHTDYIINAKYPAYKEEYLKENAFEYPISINGKVRAKMNFALDMPKEDIEKVVLASEIVQKWSEGKPPKKVIVVPGRIVNVVL
jgi:leucyl-tRNA synthetase